MWGGCAPDFISACGKGDNNANREALFRNDSDKKKVNHSKKLEVQTEGKRKHQCQVRVVVLLSACLTAANSFCTVSEIHLHT